MENEKVRLTYNDAYEAINVLGLWEFIQKHKIKSFLLYPLPIFRQLYKLSIKNVLLSENTYEMIMFHMKKIACIGYCKWEKEYIKSYYPHIYIAARRIDKILYDVFSNPFYKKGRERIEKMFQNPFSY